MLAGKQLLRKAKSVISSDQTIVSPPPTRSVRLAPHRPVKRILSAQILILAQSIVFSIQSRVFTAPEALEWPV